jgi:ABC-type uncharacterized transport system auxiliary subunit
VSRLPAFAGAVALAVCVGGCLFRTAEAPRFYRPASVALDGRDDASTDGHAVAGDALAEPPRVRLHTVHSAPFLRERMVWRASDVEYGFYEQRRWSELPSRYVRRAVATTLEATAGVLLVDDVNAPRLDVEVLAFDEVVAPKHEASVVLAATMRQADRTLLDRTYAARVAIATDDGSGTAQAMGKALDEVAKAVADGVARSLAPHHAPVPARARRAH